MKIEFIFNGAHQLKLTPENGKEKQLLQLCFGERPEIQIIAGPAEVVIIQASEVSKQDSNQFNEKLYGGQAIPLAIPLDILGRKYEVKGLNDTEK